MYKTAAETRTRMRRPKKSSAAPGRKRSEHLREHIAQNQSLPVAEARARFADLLNKVAYRKDRIVLTRHGKGIVALIPAEDLEDLEAIEDRIDSELLHGVSEEESSRDLVPWTTIKREARKRR